MARHLHFILSLWIFVLPVAAAELVSYPADPTEFLFVVDASSNMRRAAPASRAAVGTLLANGAQGRMRRGDVFTVWLVQDTILTNAFNLERWLPEIAMAQAATVVKALESIKHTGKPAQDDAVEQFMKRSKDRRAMYVFLISDGSEVLYGTPFDLPVSTIYVEHSKDMAAKKTPFITTLMAHKGTFTAWSVDAAGSTLRIPELPLEPPPAPKVTPITAAQPASPVQITDRKTSPAPPAPKPDISTPTTIKAEVPPPTAPQTKPVPIPPPKAVTDTPRPAAKVATTAKPPLAPTPKPPPPSTPNPATLPPEETPKPVAPPPAPPTPAIIPVATQKPAVPPPARNVEAAKPKPQVAATPVTIPSSNVAPPSPAAVPKPSVANPPPPADTSRTKAELTRPITAPDIREGLEFKTAGPIVDTPREASAGPNPKPEVKPENQAPKATPKVDEIPRPPAPAQPVAVVAPDPATSAWAYIMFGVALLGGAAIMGYFLLRRQGAASGASLISESFDREQRSHHVKSKDN